MKSLRGVFFALISSGTFGLIPLFSIPLMTDSNMGLPSILFYRFLFSTILMGAICLLKKENFRISKKDIFTLSWLGLLYAATAMCLIYSYKYIPSGLATTIHFLYPIAVSFLMVVFFKERKSIVLFLAAILSLIGVALLCWNGGGSIKLIGVGIASLTVITYSVYIVGINQSSVSKMNAEILTFYILLSGAILFLIFAGVSPSGIESIPDFTAFGRLALLAFLATVVSDLTLILAIKYAGSTITSILGSMEPLVAVLIGGLYFSEYFNVNSAFGIFLILVSVSLVIIFGKQKKETLLSDKH
ncbi:DMT family transporter [Dysgonomonas sp. HGC4]|uniref:DMT family transporter n=1 Tax=Dysgonomonas sp. HGC4 TaxID=1658009 RepID=UPI00067FC6DC|nr:DMT family transporter [Dysgonomonas sp. HGC4]MBD8348934.1 DMT family transporter [Dysgonomonas sp. HGC4]